MSPVSDKTAVVLEDHIKALVFIEVTKLLTIKAKEDAEVLKEIRGDYRRTMWIMVAVLLTMMPDTGQRVLALYKAFHP